jgi:hypothetical protein
VDPAKIMFFLLGGIVIMGVGYLFVSLAVRCLPDMTTALLLLLLGIGCVVGLAGVVAGGIAYMAQAECDSGRAGMSRTLEFVRRRFIGLFLSTLILAGALLITASVLNWLMGALAGKAGFVRGFAGLLFPVQFLANAFLAVVGLVSVLVVCAAGFDEMRPLAAVRRTFEIARRNTSNLLAHLACSLFFAELLAAAGLLVVSLGLLPTMWTNGPSGADSVLSMMSMLEEIESADSPDPTLSGSNLFRSPGGSGSAFDEMLAAGDTSESDVEKSLKAQASGDMLRKLSLGLIVIIVLSIPLIYWICSFTLYYLALEAPGQVRA